MMQRGEAPMRILFFLSDDSWYSTPIESIDFVKYDPEGDRWYLHHKDSRIVDVTQYFEFENIACNTFITGGDSNELYYYVFERPAGPVWKYYADNILCMDGNRVKPSEGKSIDLKGRGEDLALGHIDRDTKNLIWTVWVAGDPDYTEGYVFDGEDTIIRFET